MNTFLSYIEEQINQLKLEEQRKIADHRKDEGNLLRIKENVYGIVRSYYEVVTKKSGNGDFCSEFLNKVQIPAKSWEEMKLKALEHGDTEKVVIEEIKLNTLKEILDTFQQLYSK